MSRENTSRRFRKPGRSIATLQNIKAWVLSLPEISMDETDSPQTPLELLIILAAIADEKIPIQTIAPKFTGRFNKGVDYRGDVEGSHANLPRTWR